MPREKNPERDSQGGLVEAERRIAAARKSGATDLNLSHLRLNRLRESLRELTWLEHLSVQRNQLTELPDRDAAWLEVTNDLIA